LSFKSFFFLF